MELLAFLSGLLGVTAAVINRKQVVIHITNVAQSNVDGYGCQGFPTESAMPTASTPQSVSIGKRLVRSVLAAIIGTGSIIVAIAAEPTSMGPFSWVAACVLAASLAVASYQVAVLGIVLLARVLQKRS